LLSLYLQYIKGFSPQSAGLILVAQPAVMAVFSPLAGRWSDRVEPRWPASAGMIITAAGLGWLILLRPDTGLTWIVANLIMLGFGFALFSSPNMSAIMGSVDRRHFGIASGTVAIMRLMGQMVSMAIATVVLALYIGERPIEPELFPLFVRSFEAILSILTVLCVVGVFFSMARGRLKES
jgi:MFS family permease